MSVRIQTFYDSHCTPFLKCEWSGDVVKRSTVCRQLSRALYRYLTSQHGLDSVSASLWSNVPDYDLVDRTGFSEITHTVLYDGVSRDNGFSIWDETRSCYPNNNFRYVYYGFSLC